MTDTTARQDADQMLERLDGISSDPKWFTTGLTKIRDKLPADDAAPNLSGTVNIDGKQFRMNGTLTAIEAPPVPPVWGEDTPGCSVRVELVRRSNLMVAPECVFLKIVAEGFDHVPPEDPDAHDPSRNNIEFFTTYGDPGSRFSGPINVMAEHMDANLGFGPELAHVYEKPADEYVVSVLAVETTTGFMARTTYRIGGDNADTPAIQAPDAVFADGEIVVDPTGQGIARLPHARVVSSVKAAMAAMKGKAGPCRVTIPDGYEEDTGTLVFSGDIPSCHFVQEGAGDWFKLTCKTGSRHVFFVNYDPDRKKDCVITGGAFEGGWDATTEKGTGGGCIEQSAAQGNYFLFHNGAIRNYKGGAFATISYHDGSGARAFSNLIVEGCRSYFFYEASRAPVAYLGCRQLSHVDALSGGPRLSEGTQRYNDAAIVRFQGSGRIVIDGCDQFVRTGWFENYFGIRTQQAVLRFGQRGERGARLNIQRSSFEGSLSLARMNGNNAVNAMNILIERCTILGSAFDGRLAVLNFGGAMFRNNKMIVPDVDRISFYGLFSPNAFVRLDLPIDAGAQKGNVEECAAAPIQFVANSYLSMMRGAKAPVMVEKNEKLGMGKFLNVTQVGDVLHAPNFDTPVIADAVENVKFWLPRHKGYRAGHERYATEIEVDVPPGGEVMVAYPEGRSAADYGPATEQEDHRIGLVGHKNPQDRQAVEIAFEPNGMRLRNGSKQAWPAGDIVLVLLCPDSPATYGNFATPQIDTYPMPVTGGTVFDFYGGHPPSNS